ncbi:hypothetical protein FG386_000050 [Cryptosporidium ryanae]|uniref:uncharacterized protein n=1 Tax=Cryptosporidium ryanae TaxID=515981 RepID=UPI003519E347|nr:hypothetical protein FG386_000050 [Cryptosporidium ryanae]
MTKRSKKSETKLKKSDEKKNKQLLKSRKKYLKNINIDGIEDIVKTIEKLDFNTPLRNEGDKIQCIVINSERPSPRISSSYNIHPISGELIIFGGEFYDGREARCFHDLYKWNLEKNEWKKVVIENKVSKDGYFGGPKPRCSHQGVIFGEYLFIHGGEFSTEQQFYHFKDMWRLNLKNYIWEEVKFTGVSPSPRSGHRMVVWRHFFIVFGGFHDTVKETQYFNDIHIFNTKTLNWDKIDSSKYESLPSPRSGVQMSLCPNTDKIFICGGYSKIKDNSKNSIGKVHTDCWFLDMKPYLNDYKNPVWERVNRKGSPPSPRSGFSMTSFKNQCIIFGGVFDQEDNIGLNLNSVFYNDLFTFDFNSKRWHNINISNGSTENKTASSISIVELKDKHGTSKNDADDKPEFIDNETCDIKKSLVSEKTYFNLVDEKITNTFENFADFKLSNSQINQTRAGDVIELNYCNNVKNICEICPFPIPRINCGMFTKGNYVYIFGGLFESGKKILTLDDCWCFNILRKDGWKCILPLSINSDNFCITESESESESDFNSDQETNFSSDERSEYSDETIDDFVDTENQRKKCQPFSRKEMEELVRKHELNDLNKTPLINESLGNFFTRTKDFWIKLFRSTLSYKTLTEKEISRNAFFMANERFKTIRPFLELLRKEELKQQLNE